MKKIIATILAGFMTLSCLTAQAAGRTTAITKAIYGNSEEIHILYNDTVVKYDDVKPVNTDGRVMIPFRAALENMGATVDYNNDSRLVTAKKGDIEIKFTLMDDTIYIDKNGAQSTITMDVPMIIVSDRTLVPIRFMSNAFDMQVGWDGDSETVIILDYDDYTKAINAAAPNLAKLSKVKQPKNIKATDNFEFSLNVDGATEDKVDLSLSGKAESVLLENSMSSDLTASFSGFGIDVKDKQLSAVINDDKVYIKSDNKWYSIDIDKLINALPFPEESIEAMKSAINGIDLSAGNIKRTEGDADIVTAMSLIDSLDVYEELDKFISVAEKDNGGYECKVNLTNEDFTKAIFGMSGVSEIELGQEFAQELAKMFNVSMSANSAFDGSKGNSDVSMDFYININDVKLSLKLKLNEVFEKNDNLKATAIPNDSEDITDKLIDILK